MSLLCFEQESSEMRINARPKVLSSSRLLNKSDASVCVWAMCVCVCVKGGPMRFEPGAHWLSPLKACGHITQRRGSKVEANEPLHTEEAVFSLTFLCVKQRPLGVVVNVTMDSGSPSKACVCTSSVPNMCHTL